MCKFVFTESGSRQLLLHRCMSHPVHLIKENWLLEQRRLAGLFRVARSVDTIMKLNLLLS